MQKSNKFLIKENIYVTKCTIYYCELASYVCSATMFVSKCDTIQGYKNKKIYNLEEAPGLYRFSNTTTLIQPYVNAHVHNNKLCMLSHETLLN
jgi:hypothetical protein